MNYRKSLLKLKPGISKRGLLLLAGIVWTFAGGMLAFRGLSYLWDQPHLGVRLAIAAAIGVAFYLMVFTRVSFKHISRIKSKAVAKPCAFSFFDVKGYLMMAVMITSGILLRHFNVVNPAYLYTFYVGMGIPLLISAARFYWTWLTFSEASR